jgi:hypothetical protein
MMSRTIMIVVIGLSLITSFIILKLNANSKEGLKTTLDYYEQTQARLIANSGVEIYLEKMRRNKSLTGTYNNNPLLDGSFDISITGPDSNLVITSVGNYTGLSHTTIVKAKRDPVDMPPIFGALFVSSSTMSLKMNGNLEIDGNDYNTDGTPGPNPPLPGIAVDDPSDSAFIINEIKPKIANDIEGAGGAPSVRSATDITDWEEVTQKIIFAADYTLANGTYSTGTFGTMAEPKITFVNGTVHLSGTASGAGIMVINGDLTMSGDFKYYGIIIVYGKSTIATDIVGNGGIYGSTILVGQEVDIHASGNASFYYSSAAIDNAKINLKSSRFKIESWWE